jgi:hypothetical protein
LFFPKGLEEIKSKVSATTTGRPTSGYSWSGGFVWFEGKNAGTNVGKVKSLAMRGANTIELDGPAEKVQVGQRVEIRQRVARHELRQPAALAVFGGGVPREFTAKFNVVRHEAVLNITVA